jgi:outer membrane protein OmpA-like peptidoglycan-associated protein
MRKIIFLALALLEVLPLAAQTPATSELDQARQVLDQAQAAGAATLAQSLYDDAAARLRFAQDNWNAKDDRLREQSRMRAREAVFAGNAALAKARWLSTNAAIQTLQLDIRRFGGTSDLPLPDELPSVDYRRGNTTKTRIALAQAAVDQARQGGAMSFAGPELNTAQQLIDSARKVSLNGARENDISDHLAYNAEMIARRAYYDARFRDANNYLPDVRLQRTRLAQAASERQAAAERQQREAADRRAAELIQRLAQEQQNRAAQQAELERLRAQIDENRRTQQAQLDADRQARIAAEQKYDDLNRQYVTAISSGASPADVDALRRQIEDQQIALRAIRARQELTQAALEQEIARSRTDLDSGRSAGSMTVEVLAQRQADLLSRQAQLDAFRNERQANLTARAQIEQQQTTAITEAQRRRQEQEAAAAELRRRAEEAQRQMQLAQEQAQAAQQQAQTAQQQAQAAQQEAQTAQQQAAAAKQQVADVTNQAQQTQAELERTKRELAVSDAETRRLRLQQSLQRYAPTRRDPSRGIIVTLPSIMFDTGKATLKPGAQSTLKNIADQLKGEATLVVTVEGHTDSSGTAAKNLKLSEQRAQAVRNYLVGSGINGDHLTAIGRGEADPVAPNKTAAGRQQNRRVELIIAQ